MLFDLVIAASTKLVIGDQFPVMDSNEIAKFYATCEIKRNDDKNHEQIFFNDRLLTIT